MSEHLPTIEQHEAWQPSPEQLPELPTAHETQPVQPGEVIDPHLRAEHARSDIEQSVGRDNPLERLQASEKAAQPAVPTHINRELKGITLRRELQQLRRQLPAPQRALSKFVHQPIIRAVSEGAAKTVSRPSGLLGGGLVAFMGTSGYLYLARHQGFTYNYAVFLVLFVGGFALGLILEFFVHLVTSRHPES